MTNLSHNSFEALEAMKFVGECLVSQPTYFNDFVKHCTKARENKLKMSGLVYLLHSMINELNELTTVQIFEEACYFDCLCQIMQLVANLYLRPSSRREIVAQLAPYVIPTLAKIVSRIIDQRKSLISNLVESAREMVVDRHGNFVFCEEKMMNTNTTLTRIRFMVEQECNFCFSLTSVSFA
jgi:N-methylhydantoinase A/oxoprolinase/acetone carboxylase beta subunit